MTKSTDVVEIRIRRNKNSSAGRLFQFLMNCYNHWINEDGKTASQLVLQAAWLLYWPFVLEREGNQEKAREAAFWCIRHLESHILKMKIHFGLLDR
jgi:hypothetical protein